MAPRRQLPESHNPLLDPEHTPPLEILVERRRLGQTDLTVQTGHGNAMRTEKLGIFDYAHLRAPLPKDLKGSGIFSLQKNQTYPESYFLMRRSSDGYISATGMFKAAFPWASTEQENTERKYHKTLPSAGQEEIANNVWISPAEALKLADDYRMRPWLVALLDPEPIEKGTKNKDKGEISAPPKFDVGDITKMFAPPAASKRTRELRSTSPSKSTPRKIATPRKPRRAAKSTSVDLDNSSVKSTPSAQRKLENGVSSSETGAPSSTAPKSQPEDVVRIEVDETVEKENDTETTHVAIKVQMPTNHPDLPLPETTEEMIAKAKEMVEEAHRLEENRMRSSSKRKADEVELEEDEEAPTPNEPVSKKQKVQLFETIKKERVKTRSMVAITAALGIGAIIPYFI